MTLHYQDFDLHQLQSAGGMGKVYRATQKSSGRTVALKAIRKSKQDDPAAMSRFIQEAEILSSLTHPNIVKIYGLGQFPAGGLFMAMDYVEGEDVRHHLDQRELTLEDVSHMAQQIAGAVSFLHEHGVIHGDLKPENILLDSSKNIRLVDFGFATLLTQPDPATLVGGTLGYLPPEVLELRAAPSVRTDIYSFGVVLAELLAACPCAANPSRQEHLETLAQACADPRPSQRPGSMREILQQLRR